MSEAAGFEQDHPPVEVPFEELSPEALRGVIESFVLREGTDYGERDVAFEDKVARVRWQLERREAAIWFDPATETIAITLSRRGPGVPSG